MNHNLIEGLGLNHNFQSLTTDEQINFLLQSMLDSNMGGCAGCGSLSYLIRHHWYDNYSFPLVEHNRMVCQSCNGALTRNNMKQMKFPIPYISKDAYEQNPWVASHVLPSWDKQKIFLEKYRTYKQRLYSQFTNFRIDHSLITIHITIPESLHDNINALAGNDNYHAFCFEALEQRVNRINKRRSQHETND